VAQLKVLNPLSPGEAEIILSAKPVIVRNIHTGGKNQRSQNAFCQIPYKKYNPGRLDFSNTIQPPPHVTLNSYR